jgi:hypothetical protein
VSHMPAPPTHMVYLFICLFAKLVEKEIDGLPRK